MCGEAMQLDTRERIDRIPGIGRAKTRQAQEWVCPECDHFEEADEDLERG